MDPVDLRILEVLQANARTPNTEVARELDLAPSTTLERVRRLEERGAIRGYRAVLDPDALGLSVQAIVMVHLSHHQAGSIEEFEARIRDVPQVTACFHLTGRYDYLLQVVARDIDHLRELVTRALAAIPGVEQQETFLVLATPKPDQGLPLELVPPRGHPPNHKEP